MATSNTYRLAVFTAELGSSFVNRHIEDLAPGRTAVVSGTDVVRPPNVWDGAAPTYFVDRGARAVQARALRRLGLSETAITHGALARFLRRHGVEVVLGEFLDFFAGFVPLLDRMGMPYVIQGHGIDVSAALRDPATVRKYQNYRSARAILTRSEMHRARLIQLGLPASRIHVNIGGVDVPSEVPARDAPASKRLLTISYMVPKKGPFYLLEAFRLAHLEDPALTLDIAGGGPLVPAIRQVVSACGLTDSVRVHGVVCEAEKDRLLMQCGVFVQHSITDPETGNEEGLPASIQEAMAHGLAIVSTRHAGIPEAVAPGINGLLVDEGDAPGMAQAILEATRSARAFGEAAHQYAAKVFPWAAERDRLSGWLGLKED